MAKKNGNVNFSVKKMFPNAIRVTNKDGIRVWKFLDKEYKTKKEMYDSIMKELKT